MTQDHKPAKPRRHGPRKDKIQKTFRLNKKLMDEARVQMKEDGTRITDIVERGLILALREKGRDVILPKQIRFVLADAPPEHQILIRGLAIHMVEEQVLMEKGESLTPLEKKLSDLIFWHLTELSKLPNAEACLEEYARLYKKSAEEIAKLGRL